MSRFLDLAQKGLLREMSEKNCLDEDSLYAVVIQDKAKESMVHLIVAASLLGINPRIEVVLYNRFLSQYEIVERQSAFEVAQYRPRWWHYLVDFALPGKGVALAFEPEIRRVDEDAGTM